MRHRFGRISLRRNSSSPSEKFPITRRIVFKKKPNRHLEHTIIPEPPRMNSLEDFLDRFRPPLSFFAKRISQGDRHSLLRNAEKRGSLIPPNHSKQATLYTAQMHRISGLTPVSKRMLPRLPNRVSTEIGSGFACRCKPPKNLNSQQQPQFGQKKPSPETSSICPSAIFYPRLRVGGI